MMGTPIVKKKNEVSAKHFKMDGQKLEHGQLGANYAIGWRVKEIWHFHIIESRAEERVLRLHWGLLLHSKVFSHISPDQISRNPNDAEVLCHDILHGSHFRMTM